MFDFSRPGLQDLQLFFHGQNEAMQNTALLLGGQPALRRTQHLLDDISGASSLTPRVKHELRALHRLLTLENVCDPTSIEAACFAELDPASPITEEICLLCDAFTDHLAVLGLIDCAPDNGFSIAA